ncbi:hypothetical protein PE066_10730 [Ramlibacter tataouinensis]|uniref:hypothetical protein n=1 Tax=Ramlibacter tataouinensis TaxID=94132 RepID=UPI0022F3C23E|nr:hypothetical protein [Ramlibacter tataouinensis]WBX99961.1 hypothetical protein PE066_10730 [Ramlibacter tataouinensis]
MKRVLRRWPKLFAFLGLVLLTTACSKTITWEEEVPLNTGESIWVRRTVPWEVQSGTGNPFDWGLRARLSRQVLSFEYRRTQYSYGGGADVRWILISPAGAPVLLAESASLGWDARNSYYCVVPQYVQFVPDPRDGTRWTWPKSIEPWVFNMPANLMGNVPKPGEVKQRYTAREREERDASLRYQWPAAMRVDPQHKTSCLTDPSSILEGRVKK